MSSPFVKLCGVETCNVAKRAARPFTTRRVNRRAAFSEFPLLARAAGIDRTGSNLGAGVAGGLLFHAPMVLFFGCFNHSTALN